MGEIVHLERWRKRRSRRGHPAVNRGGGDGEGLTRLELAVERLQPLLNSAGQGSGRLERRVETELLAVLGELTMGLLEQAAARAERLARELAQGGG